MEADAATRPRTGKFANNQRWGHRRIAVDYTGRIVKGQKLRIGRTVHTVVDADVHGERATGGNVRSISIEPALEADKWQNEEIVFECGYLSVTVKNVDSVQRQEWPITLISTVTNENKMGFLNDAAG